MIRTDDHFIPHPQPPASTRSEGGSPHPSTPTLPTSRQHPTPTQPHLRTTRPTFTSSERVKRSSNAITTTTTVLKTTTTTTTATTTATARRIATATSAATDARTKRR